MAEAPAAQRGKLKRRWPAGFTLVEIGIVLVIVVVITSLSLAAFRGQTKVQALRRVRDVVAADSRFAQQQSQAGKTVSVCVVGGADVSVCGPGLVCGGACTSKVPSGGFGLYFTPCAALPCRYYEFADLDADARYDYALNLEDSPELLPDGKKTMEPPMQIYPLTVTFSGCPDLSETYSSVVFLPYSGEAKLWGSRETEACVGAGPATRLRNMVGFGPTVAGSPVQLVFNAGGGGIQER